MQFEWRMPFTGLVVLIWRIMEAAESRGLLQAVGGWKWVLRLYCSALLPVLILFPGCLYHVTDHFTLLPADFPCCEELYLFLSMNQEKTCSQVAFVTTPVSDIPAHRWTAAALGFLLWSVMSSATVNDGVPISPQDPTFNTPECVPGSGISGAHNNPIFTFVGTARLLSTVATPLYIVISNARGANCPHPSQPWFIFDSSHPNYCQVVSLSGFVYFPGN